jgi:hypothetical protein
VRLQGRRLPMTVITYSNTKYKEGIRDLFASYELDWPELKATSVNNDYVALLNDKGQVICLRLPYLLCESKFNLFDPDTEGKEYIVDMVLLSDPDRLVVSSRFDTIRMIDIHSHRLLDKFMLPRYWSVSDDYFVSSVKRGKFGRYIVNCNPITGLVVIDIEKFSIFNSIRYRNILFGTVAFLDDENILFRPGPQYSGLPCCNVTMIWDFVNNRLTQVDSLCNYEMYGLKVVDDSGYLYAKTSLRTMTRFKRTKDNRFVECGSFSMMDCNLAWFHIIDDYCLALYRYGCADPYYFVVLDKETFEVIGGASFFHPAIRSVHLTPDEKMLVTVSENSGKFLIKAVDVRRLIEAVIG